MLSVVHKRSCQALSVRPCKYCRRDECLRLVQHACELVFLSNCPYKLALLPTVVTLYTDIQFATFASAATLDTPSPSRSKRRPALILLADYLQCALAAKLSALSPCQSLALVSSHQTSCFKLSCGNDCGVLCRASASQPLLTTAGAVPTAAASSPPAATGTHRTPPRGPSKHARRRRRDPERWGLPWPAAARANGGPAQRARAGVWRAVLWRAAGGVPRRAHPACARDGCVARCAPLCGRVPRLLLFLK